MNWIKWENVKHIKACKVNQLIDWENMYFSAFSHD